MQAHKQLRSTIVRLLSNMGSAKEIQQYLKRFSQLDAARFAVVKVGGAVLRDDLDNLVSSLAFLQQVGLTPIVCLGENFTERETGKTEAVLSQQFIGGPGALTHEEFSRILLAYEPVWAIGTGRTATPEIAAAAHRFLRQCVRDQFSPEAAASLRILYGGSVKPDNIQGLMAQVELDGALVGGASLDAKSFATIVNSK